MLVAAPGATNHQSAEERETAAGAISAKENDFYAQLAHMANFVDPKAEVQKMSDK